MVLHNGVLIMPIQYYTLYILLFLTALWQYNKLMNLHILKKSRITISLVFFMYTLMYQLHTQEQIKTSVVMYY